MDKKSNSQTYIIVMLLIIITALIAGGSVYIWQQNKITKISDQQQITGGKDNTKDDTDKSIIVSEPSVIVSQPTQNLLPSPTVATKSDMELIKEAFALKYSKNVTDVNLTISKNTGSYASGGITFSGEMGGAMWYAAKKNSNWTIVFDGNGTPVCSNFSGYNFPDEIINECWDESTSSIKPL